jgi:4-amino-4-deoxy-L-arabinose transferase-like glycosyltransferase
MPSIDILGLPGAVWLVALSLVGFLLWVANAYGFHRDELYFILAGRHPDWGYVDQPPLTPLLSSAAVGLFGFSPAAVRVAPAVAAGLVVILSADMTRRFGGNRSAQILAAVVLALSGLIGAGHLDVTVTYDILFWTLALWLFLQLVALPTTSRAPRWGWPGLGLVIGLGLENKTLAIALPATVGIGLLVARRWDVLRQPWPWLAAAIATAIWLPNVLWQIIHGFPQITMAQAIAADQGSGLGGRLKAVVELLAIAGPLLWPVSIAGIDWLIRSPAARPWRALGIGLLADLALMLIVNGKSYYAAGYLPVAIAAGSIPLAGWPERGRRGLRRAAFATAAILSGATVALVMLPLVPVTALPGTPIPAVYSESIAQVGWPQLARQVESVVASLPASERESAVILTADYGQYSALTLFGRDLPPTYSGHNSTWDWGAPRGDSAPVVLVAFSDREASADFDGCRIVAVIDNGLNLSTQEQGAPIRFCDGPRKSWHELWPALRHID